MSSRKRIATTPAHRYLDRFKIAYQNLTYPYVDRGGTRQVARSLSIDEHMVIKTLVMEDDDRHPFLVLMHGDAEVSTKRLARLRGVKRVLPCPVQKAQRLTGYQVGGISPFGTRTELAVYVQESILTLDRIYINGGQRGVMIAIQPAVLRTCLDCRLINLMD